MNSIDKAVAGKYRNLDVRAAGTAHVYPAHYKVQDLMDGFVAWLDSEEAQNLHPIKLATLAHYRLASIHPFRDGNGRTSRLLMNFILLRYGYPVAVITNENRKQYIDSLAYAQENQDKTDRFLEIIIDSSKESLIDYLRIVSTVPNVKGKGRPFYAAMERFLGGQ